MKINIPKNQKGFLLIDILIGMIILAIALIAVAGMFIQSSKASRLSPKYTIAADYAQAEIENLKKNSWAYLKTSTNFDEAVQQKDNPNPNNPNDKYNIKVIKPRVSSLDNNILELEVDITFNDEKGNPIKKRFIALYTNPG